MEKYIIYNSETNMYNYWLPSYFCSILYIDQIFCKLYNFSDYNSAWLFINCWVFVLTVVHHDTDVHTPLAPRLFLGAGQTTARSEWFCHHYSLQEKKEKSDCSNKRKITQPFHRGKIFIKFRV